ncbi:MAG: hypothetical protein HPY44_13500 [Armatimonadetes bacterium]|nr:hypothetical protein [Armatimonadota bacterium]
MKDAQDMTAYDWAPHIAPGVRAFRPGAVVALFALILGIVATLYAWTNGERLAEEAAAEAADPAVSKEMLIDPVPTGAPEAPAKTGARTGLPH